MSRLGGAVFTGLDPFYGNGTKDVRVRGSGVGFGVWGLGFDSRKW